jgi:hypothetical protein
VKTYLRDQLIGTWELLSWQYTNEQGAVVDYFGEGPTGILMYDAHGHMNAQLMRAGRRLFQSPAINGGTADETYGAFHSYIAYFGTYSETVPGEVVHHVQGSLFPNWVSRNELRYASIENDVLTLNTPPVPVSGGSIVFTLRWRKVKH